MQNNMFNNMPNSMQNNGIMFMKQITEWKNQGKTPQQVLQMLIQQNPQYQTTLNQLQNMAQGRNPKEFVMQLARQNGVAEESLQAMKNFFNN